MGVDTGRQDEALRIRELRTVPEIIFHYLAPQVDLAVHALPQVADVTYVLVVLRRVDAAGATFTRRGMFWLQFAGHLVTRVGSVTGRDYPLLQSASNGALGNQMVWLRDLRPSASQPQMRYATNGEM